MTTGADVLRDAFAASRKSLDHILEGVSDDEFCWEPVAGCWTVHRRSESRGVSADGSGEWVIDWDPAQPETGPVHDNRLACGPHRWDELSLLGIRVRLGFAHIRS
jgi:hypothetical protein